MKSQHKKYGNDRIKEQKYRVQRTQQRLLLTTEQPRKNPIHIVRLYDRFMNMKQILFGNADSLSNKLFNACK